MFLQQKSTTSFRGGSRISAVIAIASFVVMAACGEPTGPRTICCTPTPERPEQIVSTLAVLADELHDAADVFAQGAEDKDVRSKAVLDGKLFGLCLTLLSTTSSEE